MGCTYSRPPPPPPPKETKTPLPSRPLPINFYYRYHALPESAPRYIPTYGRSLTAARKKKPHCPMTSLTLYQMRERPLSAKLRVVNDDAGFEDGGVDGLKKEAKKGAKKEAKKGANKEAKKEVKKEAKKEVKKEAKKEDEEREEGEEEEQSLEEVRVLYTAWMSIDFSAEGY